MKHNETSANESQSVNVRDTAGLVERCPEGTLSAGKDVTENDRGKRVDQNAGCDADSSSPGGRNDTQTELGGRKGPDPVRYGDWEKNGRCIDF